MKEMRYIDGVVSLEVDPERCTGCRLCTQVCPHGVFEMRDGKAAIVDRDACIECGACAMNCAWAAITVEAGVGCAAAIITGWIKGTEPNCGDDCCG